MKNIGPRLQIADVLRWPVYTLDPVLGHSIYDGTNSTWLRVIYGRTYRFFHSSTRSRGVVITAQPYDRGNPGGNHHTITFAKDNT